MSSHQLISVQLAASNYGYELRHQPERESRVSRESYSVFDKGRLVFSAHTLEAVSVWLQEQA